MSIASAYAAIKQGDAATLSTVMDASAFNTSAHKVATILLYTAVTYAYEHENADCFDVLMRADPDVTKVRHYNNRTALHAVFCTPCHHDSASALAAYMANAMVARGAAIDAPKDVNGMTPFDYADIDGCADMLTTAAARYAQKQAALKSAPNATVSWEKAARTRRAARTRTLAPYRFGPRGK